MYLPSSTLLCTLTPDFVSQIFNLRYITYTCLIYSEEEKPHLIQRNTFRPGLQIVEKLATPLPGNDCTSGCASDSHILTSDDDRIVSHDAPRFMLYYHCVRDTPLSVIFSTREVNIDHSARCGWFPNMFRFSSFCF